MMAESPKETRPVFLKNHLWRVAVVLLANPVASILICLIIEAPIDLPDAFLSTVFWSLYAPVFGLPFVLLSLWWILDRRIPFIVLLLVYSTAVALFFFRSGPPQMSEVERAEFESMMGEGFLEEVKKQNLKALEEQQNPETEPITE